MFKYLYRFILPEQIRMPIWRLRKAVPEKLHELRWHIATQEYISRWTEKRLDVGKYSWLFILGCNNSGTTLLTQILGSHPLIRSLPKEGQHLTEAMPNSSKLGVGRVFTQRLDCFRWIETDDSTPAKQLRYDWARHFDPPPGILMEKSPPDAVRSRWLQQNFQPCRFLAIVRSPYAVCEGIRRRRIPLRKRQSTGSVCMKSSIRNEIP